MRTSLAIGACIVPSSLASNSSRDGGAASAAISFGDPLARHCPADDHELLVATSRKSFRTFATATDRCRCHKPTRTDHLVGQRGEQRVSATARRGGVFLTTLKYTPRRAPSRASCVIAATGRPHGSPTTADDRLRTGNNLRDFRDYRLLLFQVETHSHPCFPERRARCMSARHFATDLGCLRRHLPRPSGDRIVQERPVREAPSAPGEIDGETGSVGPATPPLRRLSPQRSLAVAPV